LVERSTENRKVTGSTPVGATAKGSQDPAISMGRTSSEVRPIGVSTADVVADLAGALRRSGGHLQSVPRQFLSVNAHSRVVPFSLFLGATPRQELPDAHLTC
jgi:hypothetical protein